MDSSIPIEESQFLEDFNNINDIEIKNTNGIYRIGGIEGTNFVGLCSYFTQSGHISMLQFEGLTLKKIPDSISNLTHLRFLLMNTVKIDEMTDNITKLLLLEEINLDDLFFGDSKENFLFSDKIKVWLEQNFIRGVKISVYPYFFCESGHLNINIDRSGRCNRCYKPILNTQRFECYYCEEELDFRYYEDPECPHCGHDGGNIFNYLSSGISTFYIEMCEINKLKYFKYVLKMLQLLYSDKKEIKIEKYHEKLEISGIKTERFQQEKEWMLIFELISIQKKNNGEFISLTPFGFKFEEIVQKIEKERKEKRKKEKFERIIKKKQEKQTTEEPSVRKSYEKNTTKQLGLDKFL